MRNWKVLFSALLCVSQAFAEQSLNLKELHALSPSALRERHFSELKKDLQVLEGALSESGCVVSDVAEGRASNA